MTTHTTDRGSRLSQIACLTFHAHDAPSQCSRHNTGACWQNGRKVLPDTRESAKPFKYEAKLSEILHSSLKAVQHNCVRGRTLYGLLSV